VAAVVSTGDCPAEKAAEIAPAAFFKVTAPQLGLEPIVAG